MLGRVDQLLFHGGLMSQLLQTKLILSFPFGPIILIKLMESRCLINIQYKARVKFTFDSDTTFSPASPTNSMSQLHRCDPQPINIFDIEISVPEMPTGNV